MAQERREGSLVGGRYRLTHRLGHDVLGGTWVALDVLLQVEVDVREVRPPDGVLEGARGEWPVLAMRRARTVALLRDDPDIVAVLDVIAEDDALWLVTERMSGRSADEDLRMHGPMPAPRARQVAGALLRALARVHAAGIVHLNVTPSSVVLDDTGRVRLTGFHLWVLGPSDLAVGVPDYMSPEQLEGGAPGAESDLFSLGATLYDLTEGVGPFRRDTAQATVAAVRGEDPPPPRRNPALAPLISGLLHRDPSRRLTLSAAQLLLDPAGPDYARAPAAAYAAPATAPSASAAPPPPAAYAPTASPYRGRRSTIGTSAVPAGVVLLLAALVWLSSVTDISHEDVSAFLGAVVPWAVFALGLGFLGTQVSTAVQLARPPAHADAPGTGPLRWVAPPARWSREERTVRRAAAERAIDEELLGLDRLTATLSPGRDEDGGTDV